jgi:hypothetical protein
LAGDFYSQPLRSSEEDVQIRAPLLSESWRAFWRKLKHFWKKVKALLGESLGTFGREMKSFHKKAPKLFGKT